MGKTKVSTKGIFVALCLFLAKASHASSGTEGASFLDIPVGAGPAAMGSAYTALATNAYAPVWNPAGLARLSGNEVAGQHLSYLESVHYEYLSFVHPLALDPNSSTHQGIGFSVQYLGTGDIDRTQIDASGQPVNRGDPTGTFSSYFASYNLAYGRTVTEKLSLGATGKMIRAKIDDTSASAYAADVAGLYKMNDRLQFGASMVNLGTHLKFLSQSDSLPLAFKAGAAYEPNSRYLVSAEGVVGKNGTGSFHIGGQWRPMEMVSLRLGYKTDTLSGLSPLAGLTTGLGLHVWGQEFAYAWAPYGELGNAQYFSLLVRFGSEEERKRNLIQYHTIKNHRMVKESTMGSDASEPDAQQLMQLFSGDDAHTAQTPPSQEEKTAVTK